MRGELGGARGAPRDMRLDLARFGVVERAERERGELLGRVTFDVDGLVAHEPPSSASRSRSFAIASRTRLFTVPSGVPVRSAISRCE